MTPCSSNHRRKPRIKIPREIHFQPGKFARDNAFTLRWTKADNRIKRYKFP